MRRTATITLLLASAVGLTSPAIGQVYTPVDWDPTGLTGSTPTTSVTMTGEVNPGTWTTNMSSSWYSAFPLSATQECTNYSCLSDWTATFSAPPSEVLLYASSWRGGGSFPVPSSGPATYTFNRPFTILSGFTGAVINGLTLELHGNGLFWGILSFSGPVASLTCDTNSTGPSFQSTTFATPACPIVSYGSQCAGTGGFAPTFSVGTCLESGSPFNIAINEGLGGAQGLLFIGLGQASLNLGYGCTLNVSPLVPGSISFPLGGTGPGNGSTALVGVLPPGTSGLNFTMQAFVIDPGVTAGFSNSQGLDITVL